MSSQRNDLLKKSIVACTLCGLLLQGAGESIFLTSNAHAAEAQYAEGALYEAQQKALNEAEAWLLSYGKLSNWTVIGLVRNQKEVPESFRLSKGDEVLNNRAVYSKVSELSLAIMGYSASGANVANIAGINMMERLVNHAAMDSEGVDGLALAFLAYGYNQETTYDRPQWYSDQWVYRIIDLQNSDGSWSKSSGADGDLQSTMLALSALNYDPYAQPANSNEWLNKAAQWIASKQQENGSFAGSTLETAYGIMGLIVSQKNGANEYREQIDKGIAFLLSKQTATGSFTDAAHAEVDVTEQAYLALTAYKLMQDNQGFLLGGWYQLGPRRVTVTIEGPNGLYSSGQTTGNSVEEAVHNYLKANNIPFSLSGNYTIGEEGNLASGYAQAFASIGNIANGNSDQKAWRYGVMRSTIYDDHYHKTINIAGLHNEDKILVYFGAVDKPIYSMFSIKMEGLFDFAYTSHLYEENRPFTMKIEKPVYGTNSYSIKVAEDVTVHLNGKTYKSDKNGLVQVSGLEAGKYPLIIMDAGGSIVTSRYTLTIASPNYTYYKDHKDISDWALQGIGHGLLSGIIKGTSKSPMLLSPQKSVTRAEFIIMLMRMLEVMNYDAETNVYNDVLSNQWFSKEINKAYELGIVDVTSGNFRPSAPITREEAAIMLVKAGQLSEYGTEARHLFDDITKLSTASKQAIQAVNEHRIMQGDKTAFRPSDILTREEAATVLMRIDNYVHRLTTFGYDSKTY